MEKMKAYNKAVDLAVYFDKIVMNFSRYHKYGIGIDMKKLSQEIAQDIFEKIELNEKLSCEKIRRLSVLVNICNLSKGFKNKSSSGYSLKLIAELLKQINLANARAQASPDFSREDSLKSVVC
jgi:hypothetical protein